MLKIERINIIENVDNYLDLYKLEIDRIMSHAYMHSDGIDYCEQIMNGESTKSYTNGDVIKSKVEFVNGNVVGFKKSRFYHENNLEVTVYVTKDEIKINKSMLQ